MIKKLRSVILLTLLFNVVTYGQTTIYSEDFEGATGSENIAGPYLGWQNGFFATTPPTNDNFFWVFDDTRCNVISGNYSMAVSDNTPATVAPFPEYRTTRNASTLVYQTTPIDATNYTNLTLDFNWICEGETGFDFVLFFTLWMPTHGLYYLVHMKAKVPLKVLPIWTFQWLTDKYST